MVACFGVYNPRRIGVRASVPVGFGATPPRVREHRLEDIVNGDHADHTTVILNHGNNGGNSNGASPNTFGTPDYPHTVHQLRNLLGAGFLGYLFALRAGAALFVLLTFVLWRGFRTRTLIVTAAALLGIAVPLAYVIAQPRNQGGYGFGYATQAIGAHWLGVGAVVLLSLALWRIIRSRAR